MANYIATDSDLTSVADAIRTKGGTSAALAFPADFVSAIAAIPTGGGGITVDEMATGEKPSGAIEITATNIIARAFQGRANITSVKALNITNNINANAFDSCSGIIVAVLKKTSSNIRTGNSFFSSCTNLETADFNVEGQWGQSIFSGCTKLKTLIVRNLSVVNLWGGIGNFNNTPFASGGSGGTLYVPASLVSSYQSASNWSTILGYTNNQIKSIESTHTDPTAPIDLTLYYADGTPISA